MRLFTLIPLLLLLCLAPVVFAQTDCPIIVNAALETVDSVCDAAGRNQLCYGNILLEATPRETVSDFHFEQSGDVVGVADVQTLQLSSFSLDDEAWGVALMRVQANLPDTLPGQNVTFLLFGNVSLSDASDEIVEVPVTATTGVNVRLRPNTTASVLQSLKNGETVTATGRLDDDSWIRVRLEDGSVGWVAADFLHGDVAQLLPATPGKPVFGPMQAFSFRSGIGDSPCDSAPDSGILIQTPQGAGTVHLSVNGVQIDLGSTVYLQAHPGDALYVNVIEGHAILTAQERTQIVPAGTVSTVPLDDNGLASGPPEYPKPYDEKRLQTLPVNSTLLEPVTVGHAATLSAIDDAIDAFSGTATNTAETVATPVVSSGETGQPSGGVNTGSDSGLPQSGQWQQTGTIVAKTCPGGDPVDSTGTIQTTITFQPDYSSLTWDFGGVDDQGRAWYFNAYRVGDNAYAYSGWEGLTGSLTFTSPTTYYGTHRGNYGDPNNGGCIYYEDYQGRYLGK